MKSKSLSNGMMVLLALVVTGCGLLDTPEKMDGMLYEIRETNKKMEGMLAEVRTTNKQMGGMLDEVKGTNTKMDGMLGEVKQTNTKMDGMNSEVKETNKKMDGMNSEVKETNKKMDGMGSSVKDTNAGLKESNEWIQESNRGIDRTGEGVHKQKLLLSIQDMLKPENTEYLVPPTGMMPGGETFAEEATTSELMKLAFVWLKEVDKGLPDESLKDPRGKYSSALVAKVDREKQVKLIALQVIAGLLPQSPRFKMDSQGAFVIGKDGKKVRDGSNTSIEEVIESEITQGGRHEKTAYALLMARAIFLRDILIDPMFEEKMDNLGEFEELSRWISYYDWIARLKFVDRVQLTTRGMLSEEDNFDEKFDPKSAQYLWERLATTADTRLGPQYRENPRFSELMSKVQDALHFWKRESQWAERLL